VLPVVCVGTAQALPRGSHRPRLRTPIRVVFGRPFTVGLPADRHSRRAVAGVADELRQHLVAHLESVAPAAPPLSGPSGAHS
jgi:1-acyl-sn-glycerol-3-phosphate acyltransferase